MITASRSPCACGARDSAIRLFCRGFARPDAPLTLRLVQGSARRHPAEGAEKCESADPLENVDCKRHSSGMTTADPKPKVLCNDELSLLVGH